MSQESSYIKTYISIRYIHLKGSIFTIEDQDDSLDGVDFMESVAEETSFY